MVQERSANCRPPSMGEIVEDIPMCHASPSICRCRAPGRLPRLHQRPSQPIRIRLLLDHLSRRREDEVRVLRENQKSPHGRSNVRTAVRESEFWAREVNTPSTLLLARSESEAEWSEDKIGTIPHHLNTEETQKEVQRRRQESTQEKISRSGTHRQTLFP